MDAKIKLVNNLINSMILDKLTYLEERDRKEEEILINCNKNKDIIISLINQTKILQLKIQEQIKLKKEQGDRSMTRDKRNLNSSSNKLNTSASMTKNSRGFRERDISSNRISDTATSNKSSARNNNVKERSGRFNLIASKSKTKLDSLKEKDKDNSNYNTIGTKPFQLNTDRGNNTERFKNKEKDLEKSKPGKSVSKRDLKTNNTINSNYNTVVGSKSVKKLIPNNSVVNKLGSVNNLSSNSLNTNPIFDKKDKKDVSKSKLKQIPVGDTETKGAYTKKKPITKKINQKPSNNNNNNKEASRSRSKNKIQNTNTRTSLNLNELQQNRSVIRKKSNHELINQDNYQLDAPNIKQINKFDVLSETNGGNSQIIPNGNVENKDKLIIDSTKEKKIQNNFKPNFISVFSLSSSKLLQFLEIKSKINLLLVNKLIRKKTIENLIQVYTNISSISEESIKNLKEKYSDSTLIGDLGLFTLSFTSTNAVEFLNIKSHPILDPNKTPKNEVVFYFRLLFQLLNFPDIHQNLDNAEYWRRAIGYLLAESKGKVGDFLKNIMTSIDFSDKNVFFISQMIEKCKKFDSLSVMKSCGETTSYVVMYLKDAFEYSGIFVDRKTLPQRIYKNHRYRIERCKVLLEKLNQFINI